MLRRLTLLLVLMVAAFPVMAYDEGCSAEYTEEQCRAMEGDGTGGSPTTGGSCPYYMCGNATAMFQDAWDWCSATGKWTNCPIEYCDYRPCIGSNCYPTWKICSQCSSREANSVHVSACPRT